jgi:uncharacterized membrane protein
MATFIAVTLLYLLYFINYYRFPFQKLSIKQSTFCIERYQSKFARGKLAKRYGLFQASLQFLYSLTILICFNSSDSTIVVDIRYNSNI